MPDNLKCPTCGRGPMQSRLNRKYNRRFWGCVGYPACKGTRNVEGLSPDERRMEREQDTDYDRAQGRRYEE